MNKIFAENGYIQYMYRNKWKRSVKKNVQGAKLKLCHVINAMAKTLQFLAHNHKHGRKSVM